MSCPVGVRTVALVGLVFAVGLTLLVVEPVTAQADGGDPIGAFDYVSRSGPSQFGACSADSCQPAHSVWDIAGWAADPDAPNQIIDVHVYLDGVRYDDTQIGWPRPDVGAVYQWAGNNAGWDVLVYIPDDAAHTVCAYAINTGTGTQNTTLGCHSFQAGPPDPADPQGNAEAVTAAPGTIRLQGWAGDPDNPTATYLASYLDGSPFVDFTGDQSRDDLHAKFPELGNANGFDQTLPVIPGLHILCLDAINGGQAGSNNPSLGCWLLDVPGVVSPGSNGARGSFDAAVYTAHGNPNGDPYWMQGWAWDPTAAHAVVRDRYLERIDPAICGCSTVHEVDQTTSDPRPDVQHTFPDAPPDTGFKVPFVAADISTPYTPHHVYDCLYIETSAGEAFLGCQPLQTITQQ